MTRKTAAAAAGGPRETEVERLQARYLRWRQWAEVGLVDEGLDKVVLQWLIGRGRHDASAAGFDHELIAMDDDVLATQDQPCW